MESRAIGNLLARAGLGQILAPRTVFSHREPSKTSKFLRHLHTSRSYAIIHFEVK